MEQTNPTTSELSCWATTWEVADLLPQLAEQGFITLPSVLQLTEGEFKEIGISHLGDRKWLLHALTQSHLSQPQGLSTTFAIFGRTTTTHTQRHCRKNCHQFYTPGKKHECTEADKCKGFDDCGQEDLHPEVGQQHIQQKRNETK